MDIRHLLGKFDELYGNPEINPHLYFAPGSLNLIGDHTDYNGGLVLSSACHFGTSLLIRKTNDRIIRIASANFPEQGTFSSDEPLTSPDVHWLNYPLGVAAQFVKKGFSIPGIELFFSGNIPFCAGLNSSGSIEMVTAFALNEILEAKMDLKDLARLANLADHDISGSGKGISDQFAVAEGSANQAVFLNTHSLEFKTIPLLFAGYKLIIANSNIPHMQGGSKYYERLAECQLAVAFLSERSELTRLAELGFPQFFKIQDRIPDEVIRRRARHVISENQRVLNSVSCLLKGEISKFGALMNASHESLRDNFDVTGTELDTLVDEAWKINGVIGSRMTGSGLGGCTISLVKEEVVDVFMKEVGKGYHAKTGNIADFYIFSGNDGVRRLSV